MSPVSFLLFLVQNIHKKSSTKDEKKNILINGGTRTRNPGLGVSGTRSNVGEMG